MLQVVLERVTVLGNVAFNHACWFLGFLSGLRSRSAQPDVTSCYGWKGVMMTSMSNKTCRLPLYGGGTVPEGTPRGPPWGDICFGGLPLQGVARSQRVPRVGRPGTTQAGSVLSLHRT